MNNTKKTWITAYDMPSATASLKAGVDGILVGDSLGMTVYGFESTKEVSVEIMARHFTAVHKACIEYKNMHNNPLPKLVLDFPFGTTENIFTALETAEKFKNVGATCFKIEGGKENIPIFLELISHGFEIVGHLGLTPQTSELKVQAKTEAEQKEILETLKIFEDIGIKNIVLECVPADFAQKAQELFSGDIIGIGAGKNTNAQILVFDDVVGRTQNNFTPKFLRRFGNTFFENVKSIQNYTSAVKNKTFPNKTEEY